MNASDRISEVYDSFVKAGPDRLMNRSKAEQLVWFVVLARCEKDMNGFSSVFEQALDENGMRVLTSGLHSIFEPELADAFSQAFQALRLDGFYEHLIWNRVSDASKRLIDEIEDRVGERLWDLDEKMAAMLDSDTRS